MQQIKSGAVSADGGGTPLAKESAKPAQEVDDGRPKVPQPPPFDFLLEMPTISAVDLDILKLTALFVARNGRKFQSELATREKANYQFDFLQPAHSLFPTFNKLVEQYTKIFQLDEKRVAPLRAQAGIAQGSDISDRDRKRAGRRALKAEVADRVAWTAWEAEQRQKEADEAEARRIAFAEIDWQDFVVVATVEFTEADDEAELEAPKSLSDVVNMSMRDKHRVAMVMEGKTLPTEQDEEQMMANAAQAAREGGDDAQEMDMDEDEEPSQAPDEIKTAANTADTNIKIRSKDYVPKCEDILLFALNRFTIAYRPLNHSQAQCQVWSNKMHCVWRDDSSRRDHRACADRVARPKVEGKATGGRTQPCRLQHAGHRCRCCCIAAQDGSTTSRHLLRGRYD